MKPQVRGRIVFLALVLIPLYLMIVLKPFDSQKAVYSQKTADPKNAMVKINNDSSATYDCAKDVKIGKKGQFKLIYIISVEGSGNTWTRQLLQSLTGYYAGGVYHEIDKEDDTDELYELAPFPGEHFKPDSGRVLGKF